MKASHMTRADIDKNRYSIIARCGFPQCRTPTQLRKHKIPIPESFFQYDVTSSPILCMKREVNTRASKNHQQPSPGIPR